MENLKQAFLFVSHLSSKPVIKEYKNIRHATENIGDCFFLYDSTAGIVPDKINKLSPYLFSNKCLFNLDYPTIGKNIIPGHAHFPLFQFFLDNPNYDYYWFIEYDVRFSGKWNLFFDAFGSVKSDLLTCHIHTYADEPSWSWWQLKHPQEHIPLYKRLRSFNPIYRISNVALSFLHKAFTTGWCGHHEVAIPTLLHHNGFTIREISGKGQYTVPGMEDRFYISANTNIKGKLSGMTMRYRPTFWLYGFQRNKLYHPVKPPAKTLRENFNYYVSASAQLINETNILIRNKLYKNYQNIISDFTKISLKNPEHISKATVGIVLTSYNHIDYTERALKSFYSTVNEKIDYELWLLDDNSTEDIESVYKKYKNAGLKFFKNSNNNGLTSLWNKGFEFNNDKKYLILCNNDVIFSNHWADNLIFSLSNAHSFSVAVPVTNAPGHVPQQNITNFIKNYIPNDNQKEINFISEQIKDLTPQRISKGNGFCWAIKVSLLTNNLRKGTPFNENFPLYGGEDEFFARVKPKTMLVPSSFIFHYKHVSVGSDYFPDQEFRSKNIAVN